MIHRLWKQSPPLMACCYLMLATFAGSLIGILVDPRIITGVPAWLKPAKFGISTAIFAATVAWLYQYIPDWPRLKRVTEWIFTVVLIVEIALIDLQAARGTTSHFNAATKFDATLFAIMGAAIGVLLVASVALTYALFRQPFSNRAWGSSLRLGALIYVLGAASAGFMVAPTAEQRAALAAHEKVSVVGAHTVGAPDGGEGLPGVGWSTHHGDLRIPHFLGLHALQLVPFLGWIIGRMRRGAALVFVAAGSYVTLFALLVWQALRGQSILEPDSTTLIALACWVGLTALFAIVAGRKTENYDTRAAVLSM